MKFGKIFNSYCIYIYLIQKGTLCNYYQDWNTLCKEQSKCIAYSSRGKHSLRWIPGAILLVHYVRTVSPPLALGNRNPNKQNSLQNMLKWGVSDSWHFSKVGLLREILLACCLKWRSPWNAFVNYFRGNVWIEEERGDFSRVVSTVIHHTHSDPNVELVSILKQSAY